MFSAHLVGGESVFSAHLLPGRVCSQRIFCPGGGENKNLFSTHLLLPGGVCSSVSYEMFAYSSELVPKNLLRPTN